MGVVSIALITSDIGRVVSNFIMQALKGELISVGQWVVGCDVVVKVYAPGNQTRSFMYITDLVEGLLRLMNSNYTMPVNLVSIILLLWLRYGNVG